LLSPGDLSASFALSDVLVKNQDASRAVKCLADAIKLARNAQDRASLHLQISHVHLQPGGMGVEAASIALQKAENEARVVRGNEGGVWERILDAKRILEAHTDTLGEGLGVGGVDELLGKGREMERAGNSAGAARIFEDAVQLSPRDSVVLNALALAQYRLGRFADAIKNLKRAIAINSNDGAYFVNLGACLYETRDFQVQYGERQPNFLSSLACNKQEEQTLHTNFIFLLKGRNVASSP